MIKFILGKSGSGKTKWLIDQANNDKKTGHGNIVFIDVEDSHIFSLDHQIRLINATDFNINNMDRLFGFLGGIISKDYDIEKIYVDAIYEVIPYDEVSYTELYKVLDFISSEFQVDFFFGLDKKEEELPEILRKHVEILQALLRSEEVV